MKVHDKCVSYECEMPYTVPGYPCCTLPSVTHAQRSRVAIRMECPRRVTITSASAQPPTPARPLQITNSHRY